MLYYKLKSFEFEYDFDDGDPVEREIHAPMQIIREAMRSIRREHYPYLDLLEDQNIPHHFTYRSESFVETQLRYANGDPSRPVKLWILNETVYLVVPDHDVGVQIRLLCGVKPSRIDGCRTPEAVEQTEPV
ncbi:MAG: hypothetical protein EOP83_26410 [Verrucomicrobiaceae bacterium]|nr:MAG: hypothetical protein EOP83_26410 [Verrucomicrobiaceae bacterium]